MIVPKIGQTYAAVALHYDELDVFYREILGRSCSSRLLADRSETPTEAADALAELSPSVST